jgi:hypothetical protein
MGRLFGANVVRRFERELRLRCPLEQVRQLGSFFTAGPARTVGGAVNAASAGGTDIVLIRPGNYPETLTVTKPVTLRATRAGGVTIGQ